MWGYRVVGKIDCVKNKLFYINLSVIYFIIFEAIVALFECVYTALVKELGVLSETRNVCCGERRVVNRIIS